MLLVPLMLNPIKYGFQSFSYWTKIEKNQYLPNFFLDNQFATNVKSNNESKDAIAIIEKLFLHMKYKLPDKKLMKKTVNETCKFFIHSIKYMSSKDQIALYTI